MTNGGTFDMSVPNIADHVVQEHTHETMIPPDRPAFAPGHAGQDRSGQFEPTGDHAPLILTLALHGEDQARFDRLRIAHFPPERNLIPAHITMFHHLPGP